MNKVLHVLPIILLAVTSVFSQVPSGTKPGMAVLPKEGQITGKIIDATSNAPMEYANVAVYRKQDSKLVSGGIAKSDGTFQISGIPAGTYYVEAAFIGFEKKTIDDIKIGQGGSTVNLGTIPLASSSQKIGDVNVVAERNRVEYKIDKKVINVENDINAAGGTAVTALENTPSVDVDIDGNVSLRGSTNFTVLIDGRPSVLSGTDALKQIPASAIQNIEIITNPSVKYDPDGMAGIINVVMKKNVLSGVNGVFNAHIGTGDKYGSDLLLNLKKKKYNLFFGANWDDETNKGTGKSTRESYSGDSTTYLVTDGHRDQTRNVKRINLGSDLYLSDKTTLTLSAQTGTYAFDELGGGNIHKYMLPASADTFSVQNNVSSRNGNFWTGNMNFQTKFNEDGTHKLEGSFFYRNRVGNQSENDDELLANARYSPTNEYLTRVVTTDHSLSDNYRMNLDYTLPLKNEGRLEAGLQGRLEDETDNFNFKTFNKASGSFIENPMFTSNLISKDHIYSVYSTYAGKFRSFGYQLGLRGEYNKRTIEDDGQTNQIYKLDRFDYFPSLHLSYNFANENQLMASYSRRIDRPDGHDLDPHPNYMNQYTIRTGNPNLKPQYTNSYELSYLLKFGKSFISLESFYRTTNDLMTRIQQMKDGIIYMTMDNMNRDYSLGGELMGNFNLAKWLLLNASTSIYNYQIKGQILGRSIDKQSTNYNGRLNATVKFTPDSRMELTGYYRGPSVSAQGDSKSMFFSNLSYRQDLMKKKLSATVSVRDIFGTGRWQGSSYGQGFKSNFRFQREPRVVMLTLSYKINNFKMDKTPSDDQASPSMEDNGYQP
jgi:outer membrane receptor protein involved in Fe transport